MAIRAPRSRSTSPKPGIDVALSVRSPVNIVPRELFGVPILVFPAAEQWLPSRVADALNAPLIRFAIGSIEKLGLKRSAKGPLQSIEEDGRVPLIDIGTLDAIRDGRIKLRGDVASFARESVAFRQSPAERFDAIILATGFRPDLRPLLPDAKGVLNATGAPLVSGRATAEPGLFFCGAIPSALGQFRQIGIEAQRIADAAQVAARPLSSPVSRPDELFDPGRNRLARRTQALLVEQVRVVGRLEVDLTSAQAVGARLGDEAGRGIDRARSADGDKKLSLAQRPVDQVQGERHFAEPHHMRTHCSGTPAIRACMRWPSDHRATDEPRHSRRNAPSKVRHAYG